MGTPINLKDRIKKHEGLRLTPYEDSEGIMTVCYGRNLRDVPFTQEEADFMFETDFLKAQNGAKKFPLYETLNGPRRGVVIEMVFQMGRAGVANFHRFWLAVGAQEWDLAATEMLDSKWHEQTPERAEELSEVFRNGIDIIS